MAPKSKQQKMSLGTFLGDQTLGSWADEMDDMPLPSSGESRTGYGGERRNYNPMSSFGDREYAGDRGYPRDQLPLPTRPPYTAHLGNLSFDVTGGDIEDFFGGCSVTNVRIVEDKMDHKPKGFGYVEFASLDGLKKALELNSTQFQSRSIRVSVAEPPKDRGETRDISDWSRKGPLPDLPSNQRRPSDRPGAGSYRQYDAASDAGSERGSRRPPFEQGDGKVRDFSNWERKGPLSPSPSAISMRDSGRVRSNAGGERAERAFDRKPSPSWGEGRSQDGGSRPPRRDFSERPVIEKQPTAADMDSKWRERMRPDAPAKSPAPTPEPSAPTSPAAAAPIVPASRPKLNLAKRTTASEAPTEPASPSTAPESKANPFGAARPIDTATRDKEIAEKREQARVQKEKEDKEREEKLEVEREEKRAAEKAARAEKAAAAPAQGNDNKPATSAIQGGMERNGNKPATSATSGGTEKEKEKEKTNGASSSPPAGPTKSYEILRRMTDQDNGNTADGEDGTVDTPANGDIVDDKSVKPKVIVRDIASPGEVQQQPITESMEEDGWSTVSKPTRKGRQGNQAARAIAS